MQEYPNGPSNGNNDTPLNLVVVNDELLLEDFDGVKSSGFLRLREHDLSEVALSEHCKEVEVIQANASTSSRVGCERQRLSRRSGDTRAGGRSR